MQRYLRGHWANRWTVIGAIAIGCLTVGATTAPAATITISSSTDTFGPVGDFFLVSGNDAVSSPGQVQEVLGGPSCCLQNADPEFETRITDMGDLWTVLNSGGITSANNLVFGFGVNQTGALGTNYVDINALTLTFDTLSFDLGTNIIRVYNYSQGQDTAEARIGVTLPYDFMQQYNASSTEPFTIFSSISHGDDGFEIYFLSSGFTADVNPPPCVGDCGGGGGINPTPEPVSLMLLGSGLVAAAIVRRRWPSKLL